MIRARAKQASARTALPALAAVVVALAVLPPAPASAGRLLVTGHDADLHCADGGAQCHFVRVALEYVRAGAPNPSAPVLVLDRLDLDLSRALDTAEVGGPANVPHVVIDPRSAEFTSHPLTTDRYSAIAIASDVNCGGCDLNELFSRAGGDTPDSDAINARKAALEAFFNAGGGIYANSGAVHANGSAEDGADVYYDFLPVPATGAAVQAPFCLTDEGKALGFLDTRCPDKDRHSGDGSLQDINCCATHNSFQLPPVADELQVAEVDGAGLAETLFAEGQIREGNLVRQPLPPPPVTDRTPPETTIVTGPSGTVRDRTPTFTFTSDEPGSTFECSIDGQAFVPCASPYTPPRLGAGRHTFAVRAADPTGNVGGEASSTFEIALRLAELPAPRIGRRVNVEQVPGRGPVLVAVPRRASASGNAGQKGVRWVRLEEARQIPVRSLLDTRRGGVRLQSARNRRGRIQAAVVSRGIFQVLQSRRRRARGLTELRLKGARFRRCRLSGGAQVGRAASTRRLAGAARRRRLSRRIVRRLRASARGRFRTRGRRSAATVRGTVWVTYDRCDGTLTRVRRGRVVVRDLRRRRNIVVRAGKGYLARAPGF